MKKRLIIFTKYPEKGKVKTRIGKILGHEKALEIHKKLVKQTLSAANSLEGMIEIEISFRGGRKEQFKGWLGGNYLYKENPETDLGKAMHQAFVEAFEDGVEQVVLIGTDCPSRDEIILNEVFSSLEKNEVVIGPAKDGGYYLIGLRKENQELFEGILWSTDVVYRKTLSKIKDLELSYHVLPMLQDVDEVEDLKTANIDI